MGKANWLTALVIALAALVVYGRIAAPSTSLGTRRPGTDTASPSAPASAAPAAADASCTMSALRVTVATGAGAAGTVQSLDFENISASACRLPAYPAVAFAGGPKGPAIGPDAVRRDTGAALAVALRPGQVAHAWLQIVAAGDYPANRCHPVVAGGLSISLGGTEAAEYVPDPVTVCARPPASSVEIGVFPMQAGQPAPRTVP